MTTRNATDDGTFCRILVKFDQSRWYWALKLDATTQFRGQTVPMYLFLEPDGTTLATMPYNPLIGQPLRERPAQLVDGVLALADEPARAAGANPSRSGS